MSTPAFLPDSVAKLPMFESMTDAERQQLLAIAREVEFAPGEVIVRQGKKSQVLWIVLEGRCQVVRQTDDDRPRDAVLADLGSQQHFGEMSFFHAAPHSADVRAVTAVKLVRIGRDDFQKLIDSGNLAAYKLAFNILDELADRLRRMDQWVTELLTNEPAGEQSLEHSSEWSHFREKLFSSMKL